MRRQRREFRTGGEQRGKMEHAIHLELREHPVEQIVIGDRSGEFAANERRQLRVERVDVERDDGGFAARQAGDERMADLAARAGNQHDRFSHAQILVPGADGRAIRRAMVRTSFEQPLFSFTTMIWATPCESVV